MDLSFGNIGEAGARAVAEHIPGGLTSLHLGFGKYGGLPLNYDAQRAVAQIVPARFREGLRFY